jgi:sugar phosphate isomerase/epimerase
MKVYFSSPQVDLEQLEDLKKVGFRGWEVIAEGPQKLDGEMISLLDYLKSPYDLEISVHSPFSDLNIASLNGPIWDGTLRQMKGAIEAAANFARVFYDPPWLFVAACGVFPGQGIAKE